MTRKGALLEYLASFRSQDNPQVQRAYNAFRLLDATDADTLELPNEKTRDAVVAAVEANTQGFVALVHGQMLEWLGGDNVDPK
jgi:hypothetical protein